MTTGAWVLVVAVVLAAAYGAWRRRTDGRFRGVAGVVSTDTNDTNDTDDEASATSEPSPLVAPVETRSVLAGTAFEADLGERATLLQFSSAFCAPCRATRTVLGQVAEMTPGVVHVEVDAEHHLELVRRLGVLRTPTTLVLDPAGREVTRAGGAPSRDQVLVALAGALP